MSSVTRSHVFTFPRIPSVNLSSSPKVSLVSFPRTTKHTVVRCSAGGGDKAEEAKSKLAEAAGDADAALKAKVSETQKGTSDFNEEAASKAKEVSKEVSDKVEEAHKANVKMMEETADNVKEGGNKMAEAVQGAWDAAKDKAEKLKEAVADE